MKKLTSAQRRVVDVMKKDRRLRLHYWSGLNATAFIDNKERMSVRWMTVLALKAEGIIEDTMDRTNYARTIYRLEEES